MKDWISVKVTFSQKMAEEFVRSSGDAEEFAFYGMPWRRTSRTSKRQTGDSVVHTYRSQDSVDVSDDSAQVAIIQYGDGGVPFGMNACTLMGKHPIIEGLFPIEPIRFIKHWLDTRDASKEATIRGILKKYRDLVGSESAGDNIVITALITAADMAGYGGDDLNVLKEHRAATRIMGHRDGED